MSVKPDTEVRIINSALDESPLRGGSIIMRGVVHPDTLQFLQVDVYQRERKPVTSSSSIWSAMKEGQPLPDIELGMRGQRYHSARDGTVYLQDPVFIIDGLQRQTAALRYMEEIGGEVRIGAVIHFATDVAWERERFRILNTTQSRVSSNVLLRNARDTNRAVLTLYGLSATDASFPLHKRVAWGQTMGRHEVMGALVLARAVLDLHRHHGTRGAGGSRALAVAEALDEVGNAIGLDKLRANIKEFIGLIDEGWPIRQIDTQSATPFLRGGFLTALARVLSSHTDFWRDDRTLWVDADLRRKIGRFPVFDPNIAHLTNQQNSAGVSMLARHIVDHINSGKRTKRLSLRNLPERRDEPDEDIETGEAA